MTEPTPGFQLQISGGTPWCVLGWRTYEQHGLEPELIAVYGPVPTQDDAAQLVQTLLEVFPAAQENYTAMPAFPVRMTADGTDSAVVA